MLVKFTCDKGKDQLYVNPDHVVSLIPTVDGATMIVTDYESDHIHSRVVVIGSLEEVAAKLNGVSNKAFDKALAMVIEWEQRRGVSECKS